MHVAQVLSALLYTIVAVSSLSVSHILHCEFTTDLQKPSPS